MRRSREVQEGIDALDELDAKAKEKGVPVEALMGRYETEWTQKEVLKCRKDFRYAAGNYFYIIEKNAKESLFDLWEAQELLWETMQWLWRMGRPAWIICSKARQLGFSTLIQAIMAWYATFFRFKTCLIVADDPGQSEWLFLKLLHIYDRLPFWLQPMIASRRMKEGIVFDNPNYELRRLYPGNSSTIIVESANKLTSIGQGKTLHAIHLSEASSFRPEGVLREIVEEDLMHAAVDEPGNFWINESTPKGVVGYWYTLCMTNWSKGRRAKFFVFYAPAFMEARRTKEPPLDFQLREGEARMREEYAAQWNRCNACGVLVPTDWLDIDKECFRCGSKNVFPVILTDGQICWYRYWEDYYRELDKGKKRSESLKKFHQEMSITFMQGFQFLGLQAFVDESMQKVAATVCNPKYVGRFDESGRFHYNDLRDPGGLGSCSICGLDHDNDSVRVWELPRSGERYFLGCDTSEGLEGGAYSVAVVFRQGKLLDPDEEVCVWRDRVGVDEIARNVFLIARAYNNAQVAIECKSNGELVQHIVMNNLKYDRIYRWKHYDTDQMYNRSRKLGWWTNERTRKMIFDYLNSSMKRGLTVIRSQNFVEEAKTCVKDDDEAQARAEEGFFDDEIIATGIAAIQLYEESSDNPFRSIVNVSRSQHGNLTPGSRWECRCDCGAEWQDQDPRQSRCPKCGRIAASARRAAEKGKQCAKCGAIWNAEASKEGFCLRCREPLDGAVPINLKGMAVLPSPEGQAERGSDRESTRFEDC